MAIERGQGGNDETAKAESDAKWGPGRQLVICESNQREDLKRRKVMMGNGFVLFGNRSLLVVRNGALVVVVVPPWPLYICME